MKSAIKISKIIEVRKKANISSDRDLVLIETVHEIQSKIEAFRKRYFKTKKKELKSLENQKRVLVRQKRKQDKQRKKQEKQRSKQEKLEKQMKDKNPFDVMDETKGVMGYAGAMNVPPAANPAHESSSESSSSELSADSFEHKDNDDSESSDDLHQPISMWSILYYGRNKEKSKDKKSKNEKPRISQPKSNSDNNKGGFLRNSVLVQKTINFFGRKSKPLQNESSGEEDNSIDPKANQRNSNMKPELNNYFIQTADKPKTEDKQENSKVNKEIEIDFFHQDKNVSSEEMDNHEKDEEAEKTQDKPPIFPYKAKEK